MVWPNLSNIDSFCLADLSPPKSFRLWLFSWKSFLCWAQKIKTELKGRLPMSQRQVETGQVNDVKACIFFQTLFSLELSQFRRIWFGLFLSTLLWNPFIWFLIHVIASILPLKLILFDRSTSWSVIGLAWREISTQGKQRRSSECASMWMSVWA